MAYGSRSDSQPRDVSLRRELRVTFKDAYSNLYLIKMSRFESNTWPKGYVYASVGEGACVLFEFLKIKGEYSNQIFALSQP